MTEENVFTSFAYRCLTCGFRFTTGGWTPAASPPPKPSPILVCPACQNPALLTEDGEIYTVDEYIRLKEKVAALFRRRQLEAVL
ncbi:hypothetical protein [Methanorbis rubei]|uniref:Uncharacterized protein n=1 Tax=Methanorbis rubei TaxID=3028300 RepID=A0AAE4MD66_9EURY|nr:hypothetical protein [Methanocorpusculaceae archaeon Cs1]